MTPNEKLFADEVLPLLRDTDLSIREISRRTGMDDRTIRRHIKKLGDPNLRREASGRGTDVEASGVEHHEDGSKTIITPAGETPRAPWEPEEMLKAHGLDPEAWVVVRVRANRWGDINDPNHQLRIDVVPKTALIVAPSVDPEWAADVPEPRWQYDSEGSVVIAGDHHAPHHDVELHEAFLAFLRAEEPQVGIILGDLLDFSTISRHRPRQGYTQTVNETLQAGYEILRAYREASPDTAWTMLRGNHDDRLEHQLIDNTERLHGVTVPGEDIPALSLRRLLRLDELAIRLIDSDWDRGKHPVTSTLTARHGYMTSPNTGTKMLAKHSNSQVQGHTHRLRFTYQTKHDPIDVRVAIEAGTMAKIEDSLGYGIDEDWQQGFVTGHVWETGEFALAPAIWVNKQLLLPWGARYTSEG